MDDIDNALAFVLNKSGPSVDKFLEIVFDFLSRRTDFYIVSEDPSKGGLGFKQGVAEKLVLRSFRMFENKYYQSKEITANAATEQQHSFSPTHCEEVPAAIDEVEISTCQTSDVTENSQISISSNQSQAQSVSPFLPTPSGENGSIPSTKTANSEASNCTLIQNSQPHSYAEASNEATPTKSSSSSSSQSKPVEREPDSNAPEVPPQDNETYNGSETSLYKWSQTQEDIEVKINLPHTITNRKQIQVNILPNSLVVKTLSENEGNCDSVFESLLAGEFFSKVDSSSSYWNFDSKQHVLNVFLEKAQGKWWKRLLLNSEEEYDLDMSKLDTTINLEDLPDGEKATIDQLKYDQLCKLKGLPTVKERQNQELLKKAWNASGSPFANTPFDPNAVKFN